MKYVVVFFVFDLLNILFRNRLLSPELLYVVDVLSNIVLRLDLLHDLLVGVLVDQFVDYCFVQL